ncbi:MAG: FGGY family carbohydrate kinase [Bacteroidales bacterium]|nr:FGGY family carbohydrate kinase [Bacteroidales bacterium]
MQIHVVREMSSEGEVFKAIAIDMGAGSIRVMLGSLSGESLELDEICRIHHEIQEADGRDTWDMDHIIREIKKGIAKAIEASGEAPQSIGVDSWGADYVLIDAHGELVDTPVAYRDKRTAGMREQWRKHMSDRDTFLRTGINFYLFNTLFQLWSVREQKVLERCSKILFIPAYISYILSGSALNELSISSTSQILQVDGAQWDHEILSRLGLEEEKLGEVIPSGTRLGRVTIAEAGHIQLENVAVCGHDTACVVAALPVENPDFAFISAGTWCIVGIESSRPLLSEEAMELGITNERAYGNGYRPLKNIVGLWLLQGLKKQLSADISFAQMEEMVREDKPVSQLIDPEDAGFYHPPDMKMAFDRFFERSGQPVPENFSDYISCAYDSLCFSFRYYMEQLEMLSQRSIEVLHLVGGGSQSDYLCQRIASICQREVISGPVEGAAMGNLIIQGIAMGKLGDLQEGRDLVKKSCRLKRYRPGAILPRAEQRYNLYLSLKT